MTALGYLPGGAFDKLGELIRNTHGSVELIVTDKAAVRGFSRCVLRTLGEFRTMLRIPAILVHPDGSAVAATAVIGYDTARPLEFTARWL